MNILLFNILLREEQYLLYCLLIHTLRWRGTGTIVEGWGCKICSSMYMNLSDGYITQSDFNVL